IWLTCTQAARRCSTSAEARLATSGAESVVVWTVINSCAVMRPVCPIIDAIGRSSREASCRVMQQSGASRTDVPQRYQAARALLQDGLHSNRTPSYCYEDCSEMQCPTNDRAQMKYLVETEDFH